MIHAFKEIRLTNSFINATGGALKVNNELVVYASQTGNLLNYSGILSDRLYETGNALLSAIQGSTAGVGGIKVTGFASSLTGIINISGLGNITVHTGEGNFIYVSGDTSTLATITSLYNTGSTLYNYINNFSGVFNASGTEYQNQINTLTSNTESTGISLKASINLVSGNLITTGQSLYNYINNYSGNSQIFTTGINPTGFDQYFVHFPLGNFSKIPKIITTIEVSGDSEILYLMNVRNRTISGYQAVFSDIISENGVVIHTIASIND